MVMSLMLTACGQKPTETEQKPEVEKKTSTVEKAETQKEQPKEKQDSKKVLGFFIAHVQNEFMAGLAKAVEDAGKSKGAVVKVYAADNDPAKQVSQVESLVAQKVDGIMIDPVSYDGVAQAIKACVDAGIPIITVHERVANQEMCAAHVGVDLKAGGKAKMEQVVKDLGGKGNIALMYGAMGHPAQIDITDGYKEVLKNYPDIKVVLEGTGNWVAEEAMKLAENWLSTGKHIDAIVCNNDGMAIGVLQALKSANKVGEIKIYGLDAVPEVIKAIKNGEISASIYNDYKTEAEKAVETILAVIDGKQVEKEIIINPVVITKENADQYLK